MKKFVLRVVRNGSPRSKGLKWNREIKRQLLFLLFLLGLFTGRAQNHLWTKSIGGAENEYAYAVAMNANGELLTAGTFSHLVDFDPGSGTHTLNPLGQWDLFLTKLDANGNFVWNKRIGGTKLVWPTSINIDPQGNIFIAGGFEGSADFDPGTGTFSLATPPGYGDDVFILKLDASGNFLWVKSFGSKWLEYGYDMTFDLLGNIYTCGSFQDTADFDPGPGVFTLTSVGGNSSAFVSKLDPSGNFVWARSVKAGVNTGYSTAGAISVDLAGDVCVTGVFNGSNDFDPGSGTFTMASVPAGFFGNSEDIFVWKLSSSGNFVWAKQMGSTETDGGTSIVNDSQGNIFLSGIFGGTVDIDPGTSIYNLVSTGGPEIFVCCLSSSGLFSWAGSFGGTSLNYEWPHMAEIQPGGDLYLTGMVTGTPDFDIGSGTFNLTAPAPDGNIFISRLTTAGSFVWATMLTSNTFGMGQSVFTAPNNVICITGNYTGTLNADPGASNLNLVSTGRNDVFIQKRGPLTGTGDMEEIFSDPVRIYPNPANHQVFILSDRETGGPVSYRFFDQAGREVLRGETSAPTHAVNLNTLAPGLYFIQLNASDGMTTKKIVIE